MEELAGLIAYSSIFFTVAVTVGGVFLFVLSLVAAFAPSTVTDIAKDSVTGTTFRIERNNDTPFNKTCRFFWALVAVFFTIGIIAYALNQGG